MLAVGYKLSGNTFMLHASSPFFGLQDLKTYKFMGLSGGTP
jgi:hypothetical protein